jgi:hypothetical protein
MNQDGRVRAPLGNAARQTTKGKHHQSDRTPVAFFLAILYTPLAYSVGACAKYRCYADVPQTTAALLAVQII